MYTGSFPLGRSRCSRILEDGVCELDRGHDGDHLPYVHGDYLPPPLIGPLDVLHLVRLHPRLACLLCGRPANAVSCEGPALTFREADSPGELECTWWFGPCGCKGREILSNT